METNIDIIMDKLYPHLPVFDEVLRNAHEIYKSRYPIDVVVDHDASTQAHCTYRHILTEAKKRFNDSLNIKHFEINGQNSWLFKRENIIIRFKKMDRDGVSANYPTKQAKVWEHSDSLPGIPEQATYLTIGYLLDLTGSEYIRSQLSLSYGKSRWCAAIIPNVGETGIIYDWENVTRQGNLAV